MPVKQYSSMAFHELTMLSEQVGLAIIVAHHGHRFVQAKRLTRLMQTPRRKAHAGKHALIPYPFQVGGSLSWLRWSQRHALRGSTLHDHTPFAVKTRIARDLIKNFSLNMKLQKQR